MYIIYVHLYRTTDSKLSVELVIKSLKSGKIPGIDNIPVKSMKSGGPILTIIFRELYQQI